MTSLAGERDQADVREAEMRQMISKAEAKRSWFVAFREWVESVATFLDEKVAAVHIFDRPMLIHVPLVSFSSLD